MAMWLVNTLIVHIAEKKQKFGQELLVTIDQFIAGMMVNISINELYKESIKYNKKNTFTYFIIGSIVMIINHLLFN